MKKIYGIILAFIITIHASYTTPAEHMQAKLEQLKTWYTQDPQKQKIIKAAGAIATACIAVLAGGTVIYFVNKHCKKTNNSSDQSVDQNSTPQNSAAQSISLEDQQTYNDNFLRAIKSNNTTGAFDWLQKGAHVNSCDTDLVTALHHAAIIGNPDAIDFLMANKASINARTKSGATPLYMATIRGNPVTVEKLLKHGADINQGDAWNQTPLIKAAESDDIKTMQILIDNSALINTQDDQGATALFAATRAASQNAVTLLLKNGADVNIATRHEKITPLMAAVANGDKNVVITLLDAQADATLKDKDGKTALDRTSQKTEPLSSAFVGNFDALKIAYQEIVQIFQTKRPQLFTHIPEDED